MEFNNDNIKCFGNFEDDIIFITWSLVEFCNYQCSYCSAKAPSIKESNKYISFENIKKILNNIFCIKKDKYLINLGGGEPTLHPNFLDIIKYINGINKDIEVLIITNCSKNLDFFEEVFKNANNIKLSVRISLHMEYQPRNRLQYYDRFILLANKYNVNVETRILFHPKYIDDSKILFNELIEIRKRLKFDITIRLLYDINNSNNIFSGYFDNDINWINEKLKDVNNINCEIFYKFEYIFNDGKKMKIKLNNLATNIGYFKNMYCCLATKSISIDPNGYIAGAICWGLDRFSFYDDNFNWFNLIKIKKCHYDKCMCIDDYSSPKFTYKEEADKYISEYKLSIMPSLISNFYGKISKINYEIYMEKIKLNKLIDSLAWWIPIKKYREKFRNKFIE